MTEMKCPKCGTERLESHQFCPNCGFNYRSAKAEIKLQPKQDSRSRRLEYLVIIGAILITAVAYNVYRAVVKTSNPAAVPQESTVRTQESYEDLVKAGNGFMDKQQFEPAVQKYQQALAIDSLHPDVIVDLGACFHGLGENEEAVFQFQRALRMNPNHPIALYNMGVVSLTVGDTTATRKWWNHYLEVAGDAPQAKVVKEQLSKM